MQHRGAFRPTCPTLVVAVTAFYLQACIVPEWDIL